MRARLIGAGLLAATLAAGAGAQEGATQVPRTVARAPVPGAVDEMALRYYAAHRQTARMDAEVRRLQRLHPGWEPPSDLADERPGAEDEEPLWDLLAADRLAELETALAARREAEPGWRPSSQLATSLRRRTLRSQVNAAALAERWEEAARLARTGRADLDPADVALAWTVAEALGRADQPTEATAILRSVIEAPGSSPAERSATIHAALRLLSMRDAEELIAVFEKREGAAGLGPLAVDVARARISAVLRDQPGRDATPEERNAFAAFARASSDPNQAGLVAWHAFKRRDFPEALTWFKLALARGGDAKIAHGLAHTLAKLGHAREAAEVAYAWREPLVNNALLFIDLLEADLTREVPVPVEPERLQRLAAVTLELASGEGAQALAWYAHNTCQFETAVVWFQRAVAWFPKEATVLGYAVTLRRLRRQREFIEVVNRYDGLFPTVVDLVWAVQEPKPLPCEPGRASAVDAGAGRGLAGGPAGGGAGLGWGRVPQPVEGRGPTSTAPRRSDFPVPVAPENDLRFTSAAGAASSATRAGPWRERSAPPPPLVARRVVGAGDLAYERLGFALLPAWNGITGPSVPTAADRAPPAGTLWAAEMAAAARGGSAHSSDQPTRTSRFQR